MQASASAASLTPPAKSPRSLFFRRFGKEKIAIFGLTIIILFSLLALLAPVLAPYDPLYQNISDSLSPPSAAHWLGADKLGRDILSRLLYGARISLATGLSVVALASVTGTLVGAFAGYAGKWWDESLMRITDIFFAFPSLILAMAIAGALGTEPAQRPDRRGCGDLADLRAPGARQVLVLRRRDFVEAAHAVGAGHGLILRRHLFPNMLSPLLVQASFDMGTTILAVAGLSFIGFGATAAHAGMGRDDQRGSQLHHHALVAYFLPCHSDAPLRRRLQPGRRRPARRARPAPAPLAKPA